MIWEIRKRFTHKGLALKMWRNTDIIGRWVYVVTSADDSYEPKWGYYTQKEALEVYME